MKEINVRLKFPEKYKETFLFQALTTIGTNKKEMEMREPENLVRDFGGYPLFGFPIYLI